eukprot:SAG31_NODE_29756_length_390_cov_0.886598_1_plen_63_part_10
MPRDLAVAVVCAVIVSAASHLRLAAAAITRTELRINVSKVTESPLPGFRFLEGGAEGGMVLAG